MNKKRKTSAISLSVLFLAAASTTLGLTLSSCAQSTSISSSTSSNSIKKVVANNIQSDLNKNIMLYNVVFPETDLYNPNSFVLSDLISNATGLAIEEFSIEYGSNWIKVNINDNFNYVFGGNAPENTVIQNDGKTLLIQDIEWCTDLADNLQVLLRNYNWWNIDVTELQKFINNNKIYSSYIIENYTPFTDGINKLAFKQMIKNAKDPAKLLTTLRSNFEFNINVTQTNPGTNIVGELEITSKYKKYIFKKLTNTGQQPTNMEISSDRLTLKIKNLQFPTYVMDNLNTSAISTKIQNIFDSKNIDSNQIINNNISDSNKENILKAFGNVKNTSVPVLSTTGQNMSISVAVDNPSSINYHQFSTPTTITINLGGANIHVNLPSGNNNGIEFANNIIKVHINAPVAPFIVQIQNPNITNEINEIILNYQIQNSNNLVNQQYVLSLIFDKINKTAPGSQTDKIDNYITWDDVDFSVQYVSQSNGVKYYRMILEIKENVNKEFSKLNGTNINSIEIRDVTRNNKVYKNKILWIKNITFYTPYNLIDATNLSAKFQEAVNELQIISPYLMDNYKDRFFNLVFGDTLSPNNARINVEHNTITIIINSNYPYVFDFGDKTSKLYLTNVNWYHQDNTINDETFDLLNQFIAENNIQKNTDIQLYSDQLVKKLFGSNVNSSVIGVEMIPTEINNYDNNTVKFKFTVDPLTNLSFVQGDINNTNTANFEFVSASEIIISTTVSPIIFDVNSDIVSEQFKQTMNDQSVTSFSQIRLSKFKDAFARNVYKAISAIPNNNITNYITEQQFVSYFSKITFSYEPNQTRVKIVSNSDNIKYLINNSNNTSIISNYMYVNDVVFSH